MANKESGLTLPQEHPLSDNWEPFRYNLSRVKLSSTEFKACLEEYLHSILLNGKDYINSNLPIHNNKSNTNHNIYQVPISAQIFELPDKDLEEVLNRLSYPPILLIKYLSRELNDIYSQSIQKDEDITILKEKISSAKLALPESNPPPINVNPEILSKANKEGDSIYAQSSKLFKPGKGILSNLLDKRKSLDIHSDYSFNLNLSSDSPYINNNEFNKINNNIECPVTSPGYDSDNSSNFSYSSIISSKSIERFDNFNLNKSTEKSDQPHQILKPFHFKAITLASRLLSNPQISEASPPHTNSKRASKKITEWTLGLLTQAHNDKQTTPDFLISNPGNQEINYEYEMKAQNIKKDELPKINNINDNTPITYEVPFSPYLPSENLISPTNDLPELCASPSGNENVCLEMTHLSNSQHWSRRGSVAISPPPFFGNNMNTKIKETDQTIVANSNCTSPTIGITSLTTQGLHSTHTALPTVSKLLSQFIDSKEEAFRPNYDERWTNFMNQHAPVILLDQEIKEETENENKLAHPLAHDLNSDTEQVYSENAIFLQRKNIIMSRLTIEECRELRHLARAGIPSYFRHKIWFECSGGAQMNEIGYYQGLIIKSVTSSSPFKPQIELDIHRTMPNNSYFSSEGQGVEKLCRILLAYSIHNPSVGYCQSMNLITATLLLVLHSEEEVFWTLASIIENVLPTKYFTSTLLVPQADQKVLKDFVSMHLPKLDQHFELLGVDLGAITFNWFLSLFTSCTPFPLLLRIWDVFLIEGDATLFRVSLAMLELTTKELLSLNNSSSIYNYLKSIPQNMIKHIPKLFKLAFCVYKSKIHSDEINVLRQKYIKEFQV